MLLIRYSERVSGIKQTLPRGHQTEAKNTPGGTTSRVRRWVVANSPARCNLEFGSEEESLRRHVLPISGRPADSRTFAYDFEVNLDRSARPAGPWLTAVSVGGAFSTTTVRCAPMRCDSEETAAPFVIA